ncbi:SDR family oxidoreductase [Streptomyces sp. SolWspMP-sol7th]|uniref:SDR family oxidoreductase n=1 Tax=Streptomyces sp. SolWspMP-sol7th TaxID=1839776 RepID=UPI0020C75092|nr:SDR family oxidoreductase [Streptomyces sp. SolWspMP-sol7th]
MRRLAVSGWDTRSPAGTRATRGWSGVRRKGRARRSGRNSWRAGRRARGSRRTSRTPERVFAEAESRLGAVTALVLCHCESVDSGLLDTTVESFDRHFAVNARGSRLMVREFGRRFRGPHGSGRIVALTSDDTAGNLPYGASKGALDRITLAAARELAGLGVTANVVNPGPVDTGGCRGRRWEHVRAATPLGRLGTPDDTAHLADFLCSPRGQWVNGQVLMSNGGFA